MVEIERYKPTNLVYSLAFYEWTTELDIFGARDLLEEMSLMISRPADIATVCDLYGCKNYAHRNLAKMDVLSKNDWNLLDYLWKRKADDLSQFALEFCCDLTSAKKFDVHIDLAAVGNSREIFLALSDFLVERLRPVYGISFALTYEYAPRSFVFGNNLYGSINDKPYKATHEQICSRSEMFQQVYLNRGSPSILQDHIRDIYEVNFLSQGHLDFMINGVTFRELVEKRKAGKLTQLNDITWRWDIPGSDMENIRADLIGAGMTVVTS